MYIGRGPVHHSYRRYGDVALILLDDRAIAVAKFIDGTWTCEHHAQENETRPERRFEPIRQPTLEAVVNEIHDRGTHDWFRRVDTKREPANPEEWLRANEAR